MNSALLTKIRALRALASSTNAHEAAAAAAAAERLIQEHRIAEADLDTGETEIMGLVLDPMGARSPTWKECLLAALETAHGCAGFARKVDGQVRCIVVGRKDDVETVRYLFTWLTAEIERLCAADPTLKGRRARYSFRVGAVAGVRDAMRAARETVRAGASSAALVRLDARVAEAEAKLPRLPAQKPLRPSVDGEAFANGHAAGQNIHMGERLPEAAASKMLVGGS